LYVTVSKNNVSNIS